MKFAETPYFLLNNFVNYKYSVVIPPDPVSEYSLLWEGSLFYNRLIDYVVGDIIPAYGIDIYNSLLIQSDTYDNDGLFVDASDNNSTLVLSGAPLHKIVNSAYGASCIYFNGASSIGTHTYTYNLSGDWTFDIVLRPASYAMESEIFKFWNSGDEGFGLYLDIDGNLTLQNNTDFSVICQSPSAVFDNNVFDLWKHVVVQNTDDIVEIKFHGSQVTSSAWVSGFSTFDNLTIGNLYEGFAEEIRVSDTQSRFTEPYTPPTSAYYDTYSTVTVSGSPARDYQNYTNTTEMSAAGDIGGIFFYDYHGAEWNFEYQTLESSSYGGYLIGMNHGIMTEGDGVLTIYIENDIEDDALTDKQKGFVPVKFSLISTDENMFNVDVHNISTDTSGALLGQVVGSNPSGGSFDIYDISTEETVNVSDAKKVYFRKDSFFHQWLNEYAVEYFRDTFGYDIDIRSYVNTDKIFVYLGKIYPAATNNDGYNYKIIYEGLKDYVNKIPPYHQQTPNLKEIINIFFDQLYHTIYTKQKDILSMNDPMEVDINYLGYLSRYYGMQDLENITLEPERYREFVRDIIHFLKRKGTFADLYVIWKVIGQSNNYLNVYERWIPKDNSSITDTSRVVLENEWEDHLYVSRDEYNWTPPTDGAGIGWYGDIAPITSGEIDICASALTSAGVKPYPHGRYDMDDKILSSNYRVELDINNEPISTLGIFPKEIADNLFYSFEFVRPAYRVARYGIVFSPIVDFTGNKNHLYSGKNERGEYYENVYAYTQSLAFRLTEIGAYIGIQCTPSTSWTFQHDLHTNHLMSQFFDLDFNQLVPDGVTYSSDGLSATATFENNSTGYMFLKEIKTSPYTKNVIGSTTNWLISHTANQPPENEDFDPENDIVIPTDNTVMVQMVTKVDPNDPDSDVQKIVVNKVELIDQDTIHVYIDEQNDYVGEINTYIEGNETVQVFAQQTASTTWEINHNLFEKGLMIACYVTEDNVQKQIQPKEMELTSESTTTLVFDEAVAGVVAIMKVGNPDIYEMLIEFESGLQVSPLYKVWGPLESEATAEEISLYGVDEYIPDINKPTETVSRIKYAEDIAGQFYNDSDYFYMDWSLDYSLEYKDIQHIDIWNDKDLLLFRTQTSGIYKPEDVDFKIHYRIQIPKGQ